MPRREPKQPVITDAAIARLIERPKAISNPSWVDELLSQASTAMGLQAKFDLQEVDSGPERGSMFIYARQAKAQAPGDWSAGLVFVPLGTDLSYPLLRCNGPHETVHVNTIEDEPIVLTPHIHILTERYQRIGKVNSGYAEPTTHYTTLRGALGTLQAMAGLHGDGVFLFEVGDA